MMKARFLLLLCLFSIQLANSQNYQTVEDINNACSQLGFSANENAEIAVDAILDKMGLYRNFVIQECPDINNAVAKNIDIGSGKKERYILYDNNFFNRIDIKAKNDWAATSVLAHEIGHHLNGHALNDEGSNHKWELEADEFSGFVLARMEATLEDAQSAINTLKYEKATSTHPAKADRLLAIEKGHNRGLGKTIVVKKIEVASEDGITSEQVLSNYIAAIGGQEKIMNIKTLKQSFNNDGTTHSMTYLTPNNYTYGLNGGSFGDNRMKSLMLDGKMYDNSSGKWELSEGQYKLLSENRTSYISEYSWLVNRTDIVYRGIESIEGISCYALEIPKLESILEYDSFTLVTNTFRTNYYSIDTGLLVFVKIRDVKDMDVKVESEYAKDSRTILHKTSSYLDYRPVKGVLFPFRIETKIEEESAEEFVSVAEYTDIQVNPSLNKEDFNPTK